MKRNAPVKTAELIKIAIPCLIEQFLLVVAGIISTAIVGRLGKAELTAATMCANLVGWLQCMYMGLSVGSTIVVGRIWGAGDKDGVKDVFDQSLKLNIMISVTIMIILLVLKKQIIGLFFGGAEQSVLDNMYLYMPYCMASMPATAFTTIVGSAQRGTGDNKTSLVGTASLNISNVILTPILIYGVSWLNIPAMGLTGAGIAFVSVRYIAVICLTIYIFATKKPILPRRWNLKLKKETILRIIHVAVPSAVEQFLFQGGFVMLQTVLITFGTVFQAGYQIGANLNGIICVPSQAISVATTALISQALGSNSLDDAEEIVKANKFIIWSVFSVIGVLFFFGAPLLVKLYTNETEVIQEAVFFVRLFAVESFAVGYMQAMTGVLKGAGDVRYTAITSAVALWGGRIFGTWILAKITGNGHVAMAIGLSLDFFSRAFLYSRKVKKGDWLHIRV